MSIALVSRRNTLVLLPVLMPFCLSSARCFCALRNTSLSGNMALTQAAKNDRPAATQNSTLHEWLECGTAVKFTTAGIFFENAVIHEVNQSTSAYRQEDSLRHSLLVGRQKENHGFPQEHFQVHSRRPNPIFHPWRYRIKNAHPGIVDTWYRKTNQFGEYSKVIDSPPEATYGHTCRKEYRKWPVKYFSFCFRVERGDWKHTAPTDRNNKVRVIAFV